MMPERVDSIDLIQHLGGDARRRQVEWSAN